MERTSIIEIYKNVDKFSDQTVKVCGWARTIRDSKSIGFIELNDGTFKSCQIVFEQEKINNFDEVKKQISGASFEVVGKVIATPNNKQAFEINAENVTILGTCAEDYPLQKKGHSVEFLRKNAYLRGRTNLFNAVFRIRSECAYAIHNFFHQRNFVYIHSPILTSSDCEGAGEMFQVTTLDLEKVAKEGKVDYSKDFFGQKVSLTVSGQLAEECLTHAFCNTYTFGPTFRAEKSVTSRHAAEFWMMEPEICFAELKDVIKLEEDMLKFIINYILEHCKDELEFLNNFVDKGLINRLNNVVNSDFVILPYTEAIEILLKAKKEFEYPVKWGIDLQTEHERYITEEVYNKPVFVTDYPKEIKAFYMRVNEDNKTVAAVDLLVPGVGELMGGSQREERLDILKERMNEMGLKEEDYWWYLNLRRYGAVKHGGFGLGFERLIMYVTGVSNIRDVEIFPRTYGSIDF